MRKIKNILAIVWATCFLLVLISACKEDDKDALLPNQGEICFQFTKITTYTLADLDDIATVKIVLEKDGVKIELPSYPLTGNTELLSTEKVRLEEGHYKLLSYRAFGKDANLIENLDITSQIGAEFIYSRNIVLKNVTIHNKEGEKFIIRFCEGVSQIVK